MTATAQFKQIEDILKSKTLPEHDNLFELLENVSNVLDDERKSYRPLASNKNSGSLIDFTSSTIPVLVIPDIHARPDFLLNILTYKGTVVSEKSVFNALVKKKIRLVCVGDIMHSERRTKERWIAAKTETDSGVYTGPAMSAEMLDGLSVLCGFMLLKKFFPEHVHILKGNHENIYNSTGEGDYSFRKYADEGQMVKRFMQEYYGDDIVYILHCVEKSLPLVFAGKKCVVSHAEPLKSYSKQEIIDARLNTTVIEGLTWTDNNEAAENSAVEIIKNLCKDEDVVYIGGHRPVLNNYEYRQNGKYIQIHNPSKQNISFIDNKKLFNPETDIFEVSK